MKPGVHNLYSLNYELWHDKHNPVAISLDFPSWCVLIANPHDIFSRLEWEGMVLNFLWNDVIILMVVTTITMVIEIVDVLYTQV